MEIYRMSPVSYFQFLFYRFEIDYGDNIEFLTSDSGSFGLYKMWLNVMCLGRDG